MQRGRLHILRSRRNTGCRSQRTGSRLRSSLLRLRSCRLRSRGKTLRQINRRSRSLAAKELRHTQIHDQHGKSHQHNTHGRHHRSRSVQVRGKRQQHPHQNRRTRHHGGRTEVAETNIRQTLIRVSTVRLIPLLPRHKTTEQRRTSIRKIGHQRSKRQQERNIRKPRAHSHRAQRRTQNIRTRVAQKHVLTGAHIPRQERRKSTGNRHTSQRQPRQVHHPTGQRIRQTSHQTVSTRNTVNAVHKVRHINVAGNKNRAKNQYQNVRALHRRKAYAHQKTNDQLQARTTHNAHAANILQPAQGKSAQNRRGNSHRQLQRLRRTVRPAKQSSHHKRQQSRRSSRQTHTAVGRSSMRRTLIRNIHHIVAVQNRAHRKRQKGTQNKSKSKNTQQLRKGGHTSSKALAPLLLETNSINRG